MEQFFAPIRRLQDDLQPFEYEEVELAVPVEEFLNYRWDWKDWATLSATVSCSAHHFLASSDDKQLPDTNASRRLQPWTILRARQL
jgi:hypothetical protein